MLFYFLIEKNTKYHTINVIKLNKITYRYSLLMYNNRIMKKHLQRYLQKQNK